MLVLELPGFNKMEKRGQGKPVSQESLFPVPLGYSCKQKWGDQKMLPSLPPPFLGSSWQPVLPALLAGGVGGSLAFQCQQSEGSLSFERGEVALVCLRSV